MDSWYQVGKLLHDPQMQLNCLIDRCRHGMDDQYWVFDYHLRRVFFVDLQWPTTLDVDLVEPCLFVQGRILHYFTFSLAFLLFLLDWFHQLQLSLSTLILNQYNTTTHFTIFHFIYSQSCLTTWAATRRWSRRASSSTPSPIP